ncbi:MAG: HAD family phosphatase [Lachnospiraceae bacterium]|nr:HAD family phosphatase [Lachnospiraceae bacterium]
MNTNIKLIVTDIDGTLVKDSSPQVYDEMIEIIQKLTDEGICFALASGRQYGSIRKMFERSDRKLYYLAENGAHILEGNKTLAVTPMKREYVEGIMADLRALYPLDCHVTASTTKGCLLESKSEDFIRLIEKGYRNDVTLTDDILKHDVEMIKLAVYKKNTIREIGESSLIPKWQDKVKTCMAGEEWVDFMDKTVDKGNALRKLQETLGIRKEETMAFGDNDNDLGLMLCAGEGYAVDNAVQMVKDAAKYTCPDYHEKGVYQVLDKLYREMKGI